MNLPVSVRKPSHKAIKNRMIKIGRHYAGSVCGKSNLLLMMPAFRQFPRGIKPVLRGFFTSPTYREHDRSKWIESLMETGALFAGNFYHANHDAWAKAGLPDVLYQPSVSVARRVIDMTRRSSRGC